MFFCSGLNRGSGAGRCQDNDRQNSRRRAYEKQRSRSFDLMLGGGYNPCLWSPVEEHKQLGTSKYESISSEEGHPTDYIHLLRDNKDDIDGYSRPPSRKMMPNVRVFVPNNCGKLSIDTSIPSDPEYVHGHCIEPGLEQRGRRYLPTNQVLDSSSGLEQRSGRNASGDRSSYDKRSENLPMNLGVEKQTNCITDVRTPSRKVSPNINRCVAVNEHRSRRKSSASKAPDVESERRPSVVQNGDKRAPLMRQPASQCDALPQGVKSGRRESSTGRRESSAGRRESSAGRRESSAGRRESSAGRRDSSAGKRDTGRQLPQIPQENGEVKQRRLIAFHEKKSHSLDSSFEEYMDDSAEVNHHTGHHHGLSVQQRRARMMHEKSYSLDMPYVHHEEEFNRGSRKDLEYSEQWHDTPRHVSYGDARTYAQAPFEHDRVPMHSEIVPGSEHPRTAPRGASSSAFARSATFISSGQEQRPARNAPSSHGDRERSSHEKRPEHSRSSQQYPGAEFYNTHHQVEPNKLDEKHKKNREKTTAGDVTASLSSHSRRASQPKNAPQQQVVKTKKVPSKLDLHKTRVDMQHKDKSEKSDGIQEKSGLRKTAQEKRFHQFRQQKSYSYEMPYEMERYEESKLPTEGHAPLTAQRRRRQHFHQQKSHSCEVPLAAPPSAAHNEAVWMQPERRYHRMAEAEGYGTPSPTRSPRSPRDAGNDLAVRSPRSPRDSGHFPSSDTLARSPRSPRDTGHVISDVTTRSPRSPRDTGALPLGDLPARASPRSPRDGGHLPPNEVTVRLPRSPRDMGDVSNGKTGDGKRFKNLAEREADFWKKKRMEFYQQQRSSSFAGHSSDDDRSKRKEQQKNSHIVTDMLAQIAKEHGSYTGDEQLMTKLQEAINVEARQQHSRSTRMQRFREQKSHSLNVDSYTKPLPVDRGPLEVGERNRSASSSHASRRDSKSGPNNHKLMSLHSMKSIKTDDVHADKTNVSVSKHKAGSGSRESSRTRSPHPSSSIPRPVGGRGAPEDPPRTSVRATTDAAVTPQAGNGNSHKTSSSGTKLGTGLRKGCCIAPSGGSSDYSESFEHQPHCMTNTPPDTAPNVCHENCTDDVVGYPRRSQMVCPDENIAGKYYVCLMVTCCAQTLACSPVHAALL